MPIPNRLNPLQRRLCRSQRPEALAVSHGPFQSGMVAFDKVVEVLSVNVGDVIKMWTVAVMDLADCLSTGWGFISADCDRTDGAAEPAQWP